MDPGAMAMLIPIFGLLIGGLAIFTRSHLGHALAERIAGRTGGSPDLEAEVRERLDFTERTIAGGKKEA